MQISTEDIKTLREKCGAGIMDCRNALKEFEGDKEKALVFLREKGFRKASSKAGRETSEGLVESYIHTGGRVGALVELNCETDFVALTEEYKELAHNIAMQVAAMNPEYVSEEDMPEDCDLPKETACLLNQAYIREPGKTINDLIVEMISKVGENIRVRKFVRFEIGC